MLFKLCNAFSATKSTLVFVSGVLAFVFVVVGSGYVVALLFASLGVQGRLLMVPFLFGLFIPFIIEAMIADIRRNLFERRMKERLEQWYAAHPELRNLHEKIHYGRF